MNDYQPKSYISEQMQALRELDELLARDAARLNAISHLPSPPSLVPELPPTGPSRARKRSKKTTPGIPQEDEGVPKQAGGKAGWTGIDVVHQDGSCVGAIGLPEFRSAVGVRFTRLLLAARYPEKYYPVKKPT